MKVFDDGMTSTLAYWPFQGYAQPIRLMLAYVQEEFEDKFYYVGSGPEYNKDGWYNEKFKLGLDFPNLPYYIDDKVRISQSHAILRYLNRKHGLDNLTEEERMRVDLADREVDDFRLNLVNLCYNYKNEDVDVIKDIYFTNKLPAHLKQFVSFLGERAWLAGEKITFVDFAFYTYLNMIRIIKYEDVYGPFPQLKQYMDRIEALPSVKSYIESPRYIAKPLWNRYAAIGY